MQRAASTIAAALLTVWALAGVTQHQRHQPTAAAASRVTAPAAPSALGDVRTLSRYPGN